MKSNQHENKQHQSTKNMQTTTAISMKTNKQQQSTIKKQTKQTTTIKMKTIVTANIITALTTAIYYNNKYNGNERQINKK